MSWIQLKLDTTPELSTAVEDQLLECGALAVTFLDGCDPTTLRTGTRHNAPVE